MNRAIHGIGLAYRQAEDHAMTLSPSLKPEWIGPPPRRVRLKRPQYPFVLDCMWLFLMPFVLVGIGVPVMLLGNLYLHFGGQTTTGKILARHTGTDSDNNTT